MRYAYERIDDFLASRDHLKADCRELGEDIAVRVEDLCVIAERNAGVFCSLLVDRS